MTKDVGIITNRDLRIINTIIIISLIITFIFVVIMSILGTKYSFHIIDINNDGLWGKIWDYCWCILLTGISFLLGQVFILKLYLDGKKRKKDKINLK